MKIDFSKLQFLGIDKKPFDLWKNRQGEQIQPCQLLGEAIYFKVKEIPMAKLGEQIFNGETVEIKALVLTDLKTFVNQEPEKNWLTLYAQREILRFLEDVKA